MKKMLLPAAGLFVLSLAFSLQSGNVNANQAFASGTCCPEDGSICSLDRHHYENKYYIYEGPCNKEVQDVFSQDVVNTSNEVSSVN